MVEPIRQITALRRLLYSFAYSYPIILPLEEVAVNPGDSVLVDIGYGMCEGLGSLYYAVAQGNPTVDP